MCGASSAQTAAQQQEANLATSEGNFYNTMTQDFNQVFGENQNILQSITSAMSPIIAAGPNQQGFSPKN